jgi:carbon-monoxide dehydrogenase small subunit
MRMIETIQFTLNGKSVRLETDGERPLLWVIRTDLGLTGTKFGCGEGYCGACTVLVGDEAVRSCQVPLKSVAGKSVRTIEGLAQGGALHPLQQAFVEHDAMQCGYCTSGMILTAYAFLKKKPRPTPPEILAGLDDNLCRCGAHTRIVQAVQVAAEKMAKGGRS